MFGMDHAILFGVLNYTLGQEYAKRAKSSPSTAVRISPRTRKLIGQDRLESLRRKSR